MRKQPLKKNLEKQISKGRRHKFQSWYRDEFGLLPVLNDDY